MKIMEFFVILGVTTKAFKVILLVTITFKVLHHLDSGTDKINMNFNKSNVSIKKI